MTVDELKRRLSYDSNTGVFTWLPRPFVPTSGKVAGNIDSYGYRRITVKIDERVCQYKAHRLAWLYVHGEWPAGEIDHIDGNRDNNALANLRLATTRQNQQNKVVKIGVSGVRGVTRHHSKWRVSISINGRRTHIGLFDTTEAASAAYEAAAAKHHGEFALSNRSKS